MELLVYTNITDCLDEALYELMRKERLSQEASMEELCKIILVKLYYERKNHSGLNFLEIGVNYGNNLDQLYDKLFLSYVPSYIYKGWEKIDIRPQTFGEIVDLLSRLDFTYGNDMELGRSFTVFLQRHYGWYVNDYSTPTVLTDYIFDVLDIKDFVSIYDPCSGIGGMLSAAYCKRGEHLKLSGNDISQTMVNITRLHLKMYGYEGDDFTCFDYTDKRNNQITIGYDCIVAQLPTRRQAFSMAGRAKSGYGEDFYDSDFAFIKGIIEQLNEDGIAAIVVPDSVIEDHKKKFIRDYLSFNAKLMNITKFEDVVTKGNYHKKSYYLLFVKKTTSQMSSQCSATLLGEDSAANEEELAAQWVKRYIQGDRSITANGHCKWFTFSDATNWNINLLFIRDKIGDKYEVVMLKDILSLKRDKERIDPEHEYQELRVRRRGMGVDVKRVYEGTHARDNLYVVKANDLVVSSFEADMGGMGYVPKELEGAVVTKNLYLFEVNKERVDSNYLMMVLNSEPVLEQLQAMNNRSHILSRISISKFLTVVIPLPDLQTQKALAKGLQRYIDKLNKAEDELTEARKGFNKQVFGRE